MRVVFFIIVTILLNIKITFAQKKKTKTKTKARIENVHMYYDNVPEPEGLDLESWVPHITREMRAKWNLDETVINLSFVVEKNGMLSDPKISSAKWKPTKEDLNHLNTIINSKGKWTAAKIGKKPVRGKYFLNLEFR